MDSNLDSNLDKKQNIGQKNLRNNTNSNEFTSIEKDYNNKTNSENTD